MPACVGPSTLTAIAGRTYPARSLVRVSAALRRYQRLLARYLRTPSALMGPKPKQTCPIAPSA